MYIYNLLWLEMNIVINTIKKQLSHLNYDKESN